MPVNSAGQNRYLQGYATPYSAHLTDQKTYEYNTNNSRLLDCRRLFFVLLYTQKEVVKVNIAEFIRNNKDLNELPFLVVFRTIFILNEMGMLKDGVDRV